MNNYKSSYTITNIERAIKEADDKGHNCVLLDVGAARAALCLAQSQIEKYYGESVGAENLESSILFSTERDAETGKLKVIFHRKEVYVETEQKIRILLGLIDILSYELKLRLPRNIEAETEKEVDNTLKILEVAARLFDSLGKNIVVNNQASAKERRVSTHEN